MRPGQMNSPAGGIRQRAANPTVLRNGKSAAPAMCRDARAHYTIFPEMPAIIRGWPGQQRVVSGVRQTEAFHGVNEAQVSRLCLSPLLQPMPALPLFTQAPVNISLPFIRLSATVFSNPQTRD